MPAVPPSFPNRLVGTALLRSNGALRLPYWLGSGRPLKDEFRIPFGRRPFTIRRFAGTRLFLTTSHHRGYSM